MNEKSKLIVKIISGIVGLLIVIAMLFLIIKSCSKVKLDTPVVTLSENVASWNYDERVDKYEISINGKIFQVEKSVTSYELSDNETFKVRSLGDDNKYLNSEWSNEVTYKNDYSKNEFTIIWKNGDVVLEIDTQVNKGDLPEYNGPLPTKDKTEKYSYIFKGWSPVITPAETDITYYAQYEEVINIYEITYFDIDGLTILETKKVEYGTIPSFTGVTPYKSSTEGYTYEFRHWSTLKNGDSNDENNIVSSDCFFYPVFKEIPKKVSVYFVVNYNDAGIVDKPILLNVDYGSKIEVKDNKVFIGEQIVTAIVAEKNAQYSYSFDKWIIPEYIKNNSIITAEFTRTLNTYTVIWQSENKNIEIDFNVPYGMVPKYDGIYPTSSKGDKYIFSGWDKSVLPVTGDVVYSANFIDTENKNIVKFYDDDGKTILAILALEDGENAIYPYASPEKNPTEKYLYTFEKWCSTLNGTTDANLMNVTNSFEVYAKYVEEVKKFKVEFRDYNNKVIKIEEVKYGESANAPDVERVDGVRFLAWDKEFECVTSDLVVKALYVKQYHVEFLDFDGTVLFDEFVDAGSTANEPENPLRDNYRFTHWDKDFSAIYEDTVITACYVGQYSISFISVDEILLTEYWVDINSLPNFNVNNDDIVGYVFKGWLEIYSNVSFDDYNFSQAKIGQGFVFKAKYNKLYEVSFVDYDGNEISETIVVEENYVLTLNDLPSIPSRTGYNSKWDESIYDMKVIDDIVLSPIYEIQSFQIKFIDDINGNEITNSTQYVNYGEFALIPTISKYKYKEYSSSGNNGEIDDINLFEFTNWYCVETNSLVTTLNDEKNKILNVTSDMTLYPVYEKRVDFPTLAIHIGDSNTSTRVTMTISISMPKNTSLYGINFTMNWINDASLEEADVRSEGYLGENYCNGNSCMGTDTDNWVTYNNKTKSLDFIWACGNGHVLTNSELTLTLTFTMPNEFTKFKESDLIVSSNSTIMYGDINGNVADIEKTNLFVWVY